MEGGKVRRIVGLMGRKDGRILQQKNSGGDEAEEYGSRGMALRVRRQRNSGGDEANEYGGRGMSEGKADEYGVRGLAEEEV